MLFIFAIFAVFITVIQIQTFNAVKAGRTLVGFQNNLACFYLKWGRKLGFMTYRVIIVLMDFFILYNAIDEGAWLVVAAVLAMIVFETRTQQLLRQTHFVATDIRGVPQDNGHYLTPATVPQATSANKAQTA
jgi:hypothetical protein